MNLLELKDISKIYGSVKALQNIDLQVSQGEWLAIMGPSGSGKTTMMNIIGCMDKPSNGSVILDGMNIAKESAKSLTNIRR
ncbi:MAG: ATP-binding cassette domain-containing protein, partial [Faecalispora jeddahensis]